MSGDLIRFEVAKSFLMSGDVHHYEINPNLQSIAHPGNTILTLVHNNGNFSNVQAKYDPINNQIFPPDFNTPLNVKVGDVGTNEFSTGVGRNTWRGFTVIEIAPNLKKMTVQYDNGQKETFQWRKPGHWIPVGIKAKDYRFNRIKMGQKRTEIEQGWF